MECVVVEWTCKNTHMRRKLDLTSWIHAVERAEIKKHTHTHMTPKTIPYLASVVMHQICAGKSGRFEMLCAKTTAKRTETDSPSPATTGVIENDH